MIYWESENISSKALSFNSIWFSVTTKKGLFPSDQDYARGTLPGGLIIESSNSGRVFLNKVDEKEIWYPRDRMLK